MCIRDRILSSRERILQPLKTRRVAIATTDNKRRSLLLLAFIVAAVAASAYMFYRRLIDWYWQSGGQKNVRLWSCMALLHRKIDSHFERVVTASENQKFWHSKIKTRLSAKQCVSSLACSLRHSWLIFRNLVVAMELMMMYVRENYCLIVQLSN